MVPDGACAEHAVKKSAKFGEEVDLLVRFGSLLLVGEIKCFLFPADSRERFNYLSNLKKACAQATRKAAAIEKHKAIAAQALGVSTEAVAGLRIVPIVVLNQDFGASLVFGDCIVTTASFLDLYLASGSYVSEGVMNRAEGAWAHSTQVLYANAVEAAERFDTFMRQPPPLARFRALLNWSSFRFPTLAGEPLVIAQMEVGDMPLEMQARYEQLQAAVE
jgi:hypothetical protein